MEKSEKVKNTMNREIARKILFVFLAVFIIAVLALVVKNIFFDKDNFTGAKSDRERALKAYYEYLSTNDWIDNYDSKYEPAEMTVFDLYNDGVPEVCARYGGFGNWTVVILSYNGGLNVHKTSGDHSGIGEYVNDVNQEEGTFFTALMRGKDARTLYKLNQFGTPEEICSCPLFLINDGAHEDMEREYNFYMEGMTSVEYVPVTDENLNKYFCADN